MEGVATCSSQYPDRRKKYRKRSFDDKVKHQPAKHVCRMERRIHRLGGSVSDPLNLEGLPDDFECPTCVPSPSDGHRRPGDQPSPLPSQLHGDPLNLEEKVSDYSLVVAQCQHHQSSDERRKKDQKKKRHRTTQRSKSHSESSEELNQIQSSSNFNPKAVTYRYGNYDKYYGYRNPGSYQDDLRLKLLQKEWFEGKRCLDIGSNTGHLTAAIAHSFAPSKITGIDIDKKLVRIAWKNLYRHTVPVVAPDGRAFPKSFVMSCGPLVPQNLSPTSSDDTGFPKNVEYIEVSTYPLMCHWVIIVLFSLPLSHPPSVFLLLLLFLLRATMSQLVRLSWKLLRSAMMLFCVSHSPNGSISTGVMMVSNWCSVKPISTYVQGADSFSNLSPGHRMLGERNWRYGVCVWKHL